MTGIITMTEENHNVLLDIKRTPAMLEHFERLAGFLELLGQKTNRSDLFHTLLDFVYSIVNGRRSVHGGGGIFLLNECDLTFSLAYPWPSRKQANLIAKEFEALENIGIVGWCIRENKTIFHPSLILYGNSETKDSQHDSNCFLMPVGVKDRIAGFLLLYTNRDEQSLKSSLTQILQIASTQTMLAADLHTLNKSLQHNNRKLEQLVNERTAEISRKNKQLNQQMKELQSLADAKLQFLAKMSHDLRTPLTSIISSACLLEDIKMQPEGHHYVEIMKNSGTILLGIIDDLLDFSRISGGSQKLNNTDFSISALLKELYDSLELAARKKGFSLHLRIGSNIPEYVNADRKRLQQILLNLLNNAIKYTDTGSVEIASDSLKTVQNELTTRFSSFSPDLAQSLYEAQKEIAEEAGKEKSHQNILFYIADTGIGISKETIESLFEAFVQADSSKKVAESGVGLGLAICKELVHLMGGRIGVSSKPDTGSVFWILLPLKSTINPERTETAVCTQKVDHYFDSFTTRVLIAEDDKVNRLMGRLLFEKFGCSVDEAENGAEAVELVKNHVYDIVFMDCQMPVMNGYEATRIIRKNKQISDYHLPIVALTAHALDSSREQCLKAGMNDFLSKPVTPEGLVEMLMKFTSHTFRKKNG
ncbi:MAG: response regulator [Chitinispirillaceae bacterium]